MSGSTWSSSFPEAWSRYSGTKQNRARRGSGEGKITINFAKGHGKGIESNAQFRYVLQDHI